MPPPDAARPADGAAAATATGAAPSAAGGAALADGFDAALYDLDGVVYVGDAAVPHAVGSIVGAAARGLRPAYVTNNASRSPGEVAAHLQRLGLPAAAEDVVTSAQAAARVLAGMLPAGAPVLVVGGPGIHEALRERGLRPVTSAREAPAALVQGFGPDVGWRDLAEGAYALAAGVPWVASNLDRTIPTAGGIAPGNGTLVGVLREVSGREPVVAGKPELPLMEESVDRTGARRALVVGDRLDTDVLGATRTGLPSLLVLTGVTGPRELFAAVPDMRPTWVAADLRALLLPCPPVAEPGPDGSARCAGAVARIDGDLVVDGWDDHRPEEVLDALRAVAALAWAEADAGRPAPGGLDAVARRLAAALPGAARP